MKVVCNGKDKVHEITCDKCNSDLEYTEADVFYTNEKKKGGIRQTIPHAFKADEHYISVYMDEYRCVKCPVCGHIIKRISFRNGLSEFVGWEKE